jgi:hypothetical protein
MSMPGELLDGLVRQWAIVPQVRDAQAGDLDSIHRILLSEFLAPWIGVLPRDSRNVKLAHRDGSGVPHHGNVGRPWHRVADELAAVVIEVRMGNQHRVRCEMLRKLVTEPDAARVGIDEDPATPCRVDAKARMRDRLDRDRTRLQIEPGIVRDVRRRDPGGQPMNVIRHLQFDLSGILPYAL